MPEETDILYAMNDAVWQIVTDHNLLADKDDNERDAIVNDAVHAAANLLKG